MTIEKKFIDEFINVTSKAAIASSFLVGKKDKISADKAAVDSMRSELNKIDMNGEVVIGEGRYGQKKSMLSIGLGCEAKYAKEFVYTENLDLNDKKSELPIGVSCRTCDRLDCSQRAFPPLHKKFDIDINSRGVSIYVSE